MDRIIALAGCEKPRDVRSLLKVHPKTAHGIVNAGEYPHRHVSRIVTNEHFVDLENCPEFFGEGFRRNVRQIKVNLVLTADTFALQANLKYLSSGDVSWNEIAICRILLFQEIPALRFRNIARASRIIGLSWNPDASALAARGFAHQSELVFAGNRRRVDLNELAIRVSRTLLITCRHCASCTRHRV